MVKELLRIAKGVSTMSKNWIAILRSKPIETQTIHGADQVPVLNPLHPFKVLCWNIQYMASKNYIFFYDQLARKGGDARPSQRDIKSTIQKTAKVIIDENPDFIFLQEMHEGSKSTDYADQTQALLEELPKEYCCYSEAFYYTVPFVPHPKVLGPIGMKLLTVSKYRIVESTRHTLPFAQGNQWIPFFGFKRCLLETVIATETQENLSLMNTHLEAFFAGSDTSQQQVMYIYHLLRNLDHDSIPWVIGGDFNLLPPNIDLEEVEEENRALYRELTEVKVLFDKFHSVATIDDLNGAEKHQHYTHFPNHKNVHAPNRTIDYVFYSHLLTKDHYVVRQQDTLDISDHLPIVSKFFLTI